MTMEFSNIFNIFQRVGASSEKALVQTLLLTLLNQNEMTVVDQYLVSGATTIMPGVATRDVTCSGRPLF